MLSCFKKNKKTVNVKTSDLKPVTDADADADLNSSNDLNTEFASFKKDDFSNSTLEEFLNLVKDITKETLDKPLILKVNPTYSESEYILIIACGIFFQKWTQQQQLQAIEYLVQEKKLNLNVFVSASCSVFSNDETPIHTLLSLKTLTRGEIRFQAIKLLVENGANLNYKSYGDNKPLNILCKNFERDEKNLVILQYLIEKGCEYDSDALNNICASFFNYIYYFDSPNLDTSFENILNAMKLLIEKGVDINSKDNFGRQAIHYLCYSYNWDIEYAWIYSHSIFKKFFRDFNSDNYASFSQRCNFYITFPIHKKHKEAISYLVNKGVDLNSCCDQNIKPIDEIYALFQQEYLKQPVLNHVKGLTN